MKNLILLVDLGNTNLKLAFWNDSANQIEKIVLINKSKYQTEIQILKILKSKCFENKTKINDSLLISVVPSVEKIIRLALEKFFQITIRRFNSKMLPEFTTKNEKVGDDLIVLFVAANSLKPKGSIIVSFGTATVLLISYKYKFEGIYIAPGWESSWKNLIQNTDLIKISPISSNSQFHGLPQNTGNAIREAIIFQQTGFIEKATTKINEELNYNFPILLTGGNLTYIEKYLKLPRMEKYDDLIWKGLKIIYHSLSKTKKS